MVAAETGGGKKKTREKTSSKDNPAIHFII